MRRIGTIAAVEGNRLDGVLERLRARGGRVTTSTRAVVQVLAEADDHLSANDIGERVRALHPDIHASTVYRILDRLTELGVLTHAHLGQRPAVYHLADDHHDHLVCENCGTVYDMPAAVMRPVARQVARDYGFELESGHFALGGRCLRCSD
jgi:Fur family ferric uptake transcriptional regulator